MLAKNSNWTVRVNLPSWRLDCPEGWVRTRENSLRLSDLELWLVRKGRGTMETLDRSIPLLPGFCAIMRPGGIYDATQDPDAPLGLTFVHFDVLTPRPRGHVVSNEIADKWPEFYYIKDLEYISAITKRIVQLARTSPLIGSNLLKGLMDDILNRSPMSFEAPLPHNLHRSRITEMIAELQSDPDMLPTVAAMAKRTGTSRSHFSRTFHELTGQTAIEYLLEARLLRARHLLTETDFSIKEISERLGYRDIFYFSRQFKEKIGVSPSSYREQAPGVDRSEIS